MRRLVRAFAEGSQGPTCESILRTGLWQLVLVDEEEEKKTEFAGDSQNLNSVGRVVGQLPGGDVERRKLWKFRSTGTRTRDCGCEHEAYGYWERRVWCGEKPIAGVEGKVGNRLCRVTDRESERQQQ